MRKMLVILYFATASSLAFAGPGPAVTKAELDSKGWLHILTADSRDHTIKPEKWQAGGSFEEIKIATDGKTVGWLADQMLTPFEGGTNYSYPVAFELNIWRDGRVFRRFSESAIQNWIFLNGGNEAAFHLAPPHGQEFYECTLFDLSTGEKLAHWALDRKDYVVPDWAKQLLVDDPLPGPDEIHNWFPDDSTSTNKSRQPQLK